MSNEGVERKHAAGVAIAKIAKENGGSLTPAEIVDAARPEESPLHSFFEWHDSTAAELYRQDQARALIRSFKIDYVVNTTRVSVPKYVRNPDVSAGSQGYVETARIRSDDDARRDLLISEFERAGTALRRARNLATYFGCTDEVDALLDSVGLVMERVDLHHYRPKQPDA